MELRDRVARILLPRLGQLGWLPPAQAFRSYRTAVNQQGYIGLDEIRSTLGYGFLQRLTVSETMVLGETDFVRVLGFGHLSTRYLLGWLPTYDGRGSAEWASLGALSNLIVSLFDTVVDGRPRPEIRRELEDFSPWLAARCAGKPANYEPATSLRAVVDLIELYFQRLQSVAQSQGVPRLPERAGQFIWRMYRAETASLSPHHSPAVMLRKNALPFAITVLPAWWSLPPGLRTGFVGFMRQVYRFGEFIGLVDDVSDFKGDADANQPNSIFSTYITGRGEDQLARDIAGQLLHCLKGLFSVPGHAPPATAHTPALLPVMAMMSWWDSALPSITVVRPAR